MQALAEALDRIRDWPVSTAAAAVRTADRGVTVAGAADHRFRLASVTKLLSATAVLVAVEEGSVGLDDPVDMPPGATVRDLLCHASGLAPDRDEALSPPRRRRIYSNRGYELLGAIVESSTGIPFATYLHEAVVEPLGLTATTLEGSPASGGTSTVHDLLGLAAAIDPHGDSVLLSSETRTAMSTPQFPDLGGVVPGFGSQEPNPWGLGPEIRGSKSPHWTGAHNAPATLGHFGRAGTFLWLDPEAGVTLVVLTDRDFGPWAISAWPALSDAVLAAGDAT